MLFLAVKISIYVVDGHNCRMIRSTSRAVYPFTFTTHNMVANTYNLSQWYARTGHSI